ncbi:MAG: hypothetical protein GY943_06115 [Chloroflexi bacterium]|nr:hypothetical protein [Chloroflexota bacterium]
MTQIDNPVMIDRILKEKTKKTKRIVISLYHGGLEYPVLQVFNLAKLFAVGIDPNSLKENEEVHTAFYAHWVEGKNNSKGTPYKNVTHLEPAAATATAAATASPELTELLQGINQKLDFIIMSIDASTPEAIAASLPVKKLTPPESLADELFNAPIFADGTAVPEKYHAGFYNWKRKHGKENTPTATEFYTWINADNSRIETRPE